MPLNKANGNMYPWVTHTWNTIKGKCPHDCSYCYMKRFGDQKPVRFDKSELKTDLGKDNFIFIGSSCDIFANEIDPIWVVRTLKRCFAFDNRYLFQTKNPQKLYSGFTSFLPDKSTIGTTIETNRAYPEMGKAQSPRQRAKWMAEIGLGFQTMVTIEPIMDFDLEFLVHLVSDCHPSWVNIGANSWSKIKLPEPPKEKIVDLIDALKEFTEVKVKDNLKRLMK